MLGSTRKIQLRRKFFCFFFLLRVFGNHFFIVVVFCTQSHLRIFFFFAILFFYALIDELDRSLRKCSSSSANATQRKQLSLQTSFVAGWLASWTKTNCCCFDLNSWRALITAEIDAQYVDLVDWGSSHEGRWGSMLFRLFVYAVDYSSIIFTCLLFLRRRMSISEIVYFMYVHMYVIKGLTTA